MNLRGRLQRLERRAPRPGPLDERDFLDEDWLDHFEGWGKQGDFANEPDFPTALAEYRGAIEAARHRSPPFFPPDDFEPRLPPKRRIGAWRLRHHYPVVEASFAWLAEMFRRGHEGIPPVSEAEFADLAAWVEAQGQRLYHLSAPSGLLEVGDGRTISVVNVCYDVWQGPRVVGTGRVAQDVRQLRARYGTQEFAEKCAPASSSSSSTA